MMLTISRFISARWTNSPNRWNCIPCHFTSTSKQASEAPVPFNDDFARSGNVEVYAREYTNFHRAFTEGVLRISFANSPELDGLVSEIYTRAERHVREAPERYPFSYVAIAALMTRTGAPSGPAQSTKLMFLARNEVISNACHWHAFVSQTPVVPCSTRRPGTCRPEMSATILVKMRGMQSRRVPQATRTIPA